ncbi:MAG: hypothetical protein XD73_0538, partial [Anaerolinea thermophila]
MVPKGGLFLVLLDFFQKNAGFVGVFFNG